MIRRSEHVSDEDLVAVADGELDAARQVEVRGHLERCWACRARAHELERAVADFVDARLHRFDEAISAGDGPRALLRARLMALAESEGVPATGGVWAWATSRGAMRVGVAATVVVVALVAWRVGTRPAAPGGDGELAAIVSPRASLTPGSTVFHSPEVLCAARVEAEPPRVERDVALAVFRKYGIADPQPRAYELDYLIAPELGGSTDVRNLWPQSYAGPWNARLKDALEDRLHALVCAGGVDLRTAQREIADDWIQAYKKYFDTDVPLAAHRTFMKDQPWR
jgi:hypothetical protein